MLNILICEDDIKQRAYLEAVVNKYISGYDMALVLSTGSPKKILDYLKNNPNVQKLYFLDIDLQHEINGIALATRIKEVDISAKIVFITVHAALSYLVFTYKIEALDYIVKDSDDIVKRVGECISIAYKRNEKMNIGERECFQVKTGDQIWTIPHNDIMFFETHLASAHKMILHTADTQIEFRAPMNKVANISPDFYRCHKSFVVNINNIKRVDKSTKEIEMVNGEIAFTTVRKIPKLLDLIGIQAGATV